MSTTSLRKLEYVVALAEHLHFGAAADAADVSQPALSSQIRELENHLGVKLFERSSTGTKLTPAGREVAARARTILAAVDELEVVAMSGEDRLHGPMRFAAIPTMAPYLMPGVVRAMQEEWPEVRVVIDELQSEVLLDAVESSEVDLGLLAMPYDTRRLHVELLGEEPFRLAFRDDHPLAAATGPVSLNVLSDLQVLLLPEGHCLREHARSACEIAGQSEYREVRAGSITTLAQMVASGMGVTLLPASAESVESRPGSGITTRPFEDPAPGRGIALVWRRTDPRAAHFASAAGSLRGAVERSIDVPSPRH